MLSFKPFNSCSVGSMSNHKGIHDQSASDKGNHMTRTRVAIIVFAASAVAAAFPRAAWAECYLENVASPQEIADGWTIHEELRVVKQVDSAPYEQGGRGNWFVDREKTTHNNVNANLSGQHDKLIDKAFQIASVNTDKKVRAKWYKVWQVQNNKNVYWLPLYYRDDISTADAHVGNYRPNPVTYEQWNSWQWYPGKG